MSKHIAKSLLDIEAVSLSPNDLFTWSSGIKSPIYCDNRITLGYPKVRQDIRDGLSELITEHFGNVEVISGTATAGIPHAAYISEKLNLPMNYVRSKSKSHGKQNQIEGAQSKNKKVVVVAIFTYGLAKADDMFKQANLPFYTLSNYNELIEVAKEEGKISENDIQTLVDWRDNL